MKVARPPRTGTRQKAGFTVVEMIIVVAMGLVVLLVMGQLFSPMFRFFQGGFARQLANSEARQCLETIKRTMANGKTSSLAISTPSTTPAAPPLSRVEFALIDGSECVITWSTTPPNSVHLQKTPPGGTLTDTVLATHVTGLNFTFEAHNPSLVSVTMEMSIPLDASGKEGSVVKMLWPNQKITMNAS